MRNLLITIAILAIFDLLLLNCANPRAPQGGPKDTIPPTLIQAYPAQETINFSGSEIILEFDERITDAKLQSNLIITPQFESRYKTIIKKNRLIMRFDEAFPDSTTMTLNFFDGITDITENNPALNLSYVFSTGNYIDSLQVSGKISDLLTGKEGQSFIVGLYPITDSLNFFQTKPYYFTTSLESGDYQISNIKNGAYRLLTFDDSNRNLLFDPSSEAYGFLRDTIVLDSNILDLDIRTVKQNVSELKLISSRSNGRYFDARFTKGLDSLKIDPYLSHSFLYETNTLRFFRDSTTKINDSTQVLIQSFDSLKSSSIDTLFVKFQESTRKPAAYSAQVYPTTDEIQILQEFSLLFTKPVQSLDTSKISFIVDSIYRIPINPSTAWNYSRNQLKWTQRFDTALIAEFFRSITPPDSASLIENDSLLNSPNTKPSRSADNPKKGLKLSIEKGAFFSIDGDTLSPMDASFSFPEKVDQGKLIINLQTDETSYSVELINKQFMTLETYPATSQLVLNLPAGDYGVRILIDSNNDGQWSQGNLLLDIEPEPVVIYPEFTALRVNWDVSIDIQF